MDGKNCRFEFTSPSLLEVKNSIMNLPCSKAVGVNCIDNYFLGISSDIVAEPIKHIFNCSYAKSIFPDQWKVVKLHPIPEDKNLPLEDISSRPVSLLNVLSKTYEQFSFGQMFSYFSDWSIILMNQHAYRNNHSS